MVYSEYFKAAQRHRETCEYLINKINDKGEYIEVPRQKKILQNIYYLSGYIIECIVSYSFFKVINYDNKKSVYELDNNNSRGYTFNKYFRDHSDKANELRLDEIRKLGGNLPSSIPIIGDCEVEEIEKLMYKQWDAKSRYTINHLEFDIDAINVKQFFDLASNIYIKMNKI